MIIKFKGPGSPLTRWSLKFGEFEYEILHNCGKIYVNADALSPIQIEQIIRNNDDHDGKTKSLIVLKLFEDKNGIPTLDKEYLMEISIKNIKGIPW